MIREVLPILVVGLLVEAFLIWAEVSGIIPGVLLRLGVLFAIVVGVPGTVLGLAAGGVQRARASQRYRRMSPAELQSAYPHIEESSMRSLTIFGNDVQAWFEALFDRTLGDDEPSAGHVEALTRRYLELLVGLHGYIESPDMLAPDENGKIALGGPSSEIGDLERTIGWLGGLAADQAALMSPRSGAVSWNSALFETSPVGSAGKDAFLTSCTPEVLRTEIERLSATIDVGKSSIVGSFLDSGAASA